MQRRDLLLSIAGLVLCTTLASPVACAMPSNPVRDRALIEDAITQGQMIPRRPEPYLIAEPITVRHGQSVSFELGTRVRYVGEGLGSETAPAGVFIVDGDDVRIGCSAGLMTVECAREARFLYAVLSRGAGNLTVTNVSASNCNHVFMTHGGAAGTGDYRKAVTSGLGTNVGRSVHISGGGARFLSAKLPKAGHGACYVAYTMGWEVTGAHYENVAHAVQWWGGNADFRNEGEPPYERKCGDGKIVDVTFRNVQAGCWGSMGRNIRIVTCSGDTAEDVAFDAEGSIDVAFDRCEAANAKNGCFSTFFFNRGVQFLHCRGKQQNPAWPLFRIYNNAQSPKNRDILIEGGQYECTSGIGTFDCGAGPARDITLRNAAFLNVRVDMIGNNNHRIMIEGNRLRFTRRSIGAFAAISAGGTHRLDAEEGLAIVRANSILSNVAQPDGTVGVKVYQFDFNGAPVSEVYGNIIQGLPGDVLCLWEGRKPGSKARFRVRQAGRVRVNDSRAASPALVDFK